MTVSAGTQVGLEVPVTSDPSASTTRREPSSGKPFPHTCRASWRGRSRGSNSMMPWWDMSSSSHGVSARLASLRKTGIGLVGTPRARSDAGERIIGGGRSPLRRSCDQRSVAVAAVNQEQVDVRCLGNATWRATDPWQGHGHRGAVPDVRARRSVRSRSVERVSRRRSRSAQPCRERSEPRTRAAVDARTVTGAPTGQASPGADRLR